MIGSGVVVWGLWVPVECGLTVGGCTVDEEIVITIVVEAKGLQ